MRRVTCLVLCALLGTVLADDSDQALMRAKELLAERAYLDAAAALEELLQAELQPALSDEARYLRLHALALAKQHEQVVLESQAALQHIADAGWARKTTYLLAESYLALRRFEDGARLYAEQIARIASADDRGELAGLYEQIADEAFAGYQRGSEGDAIDALHRVPDYGRALRFYAKASEIYPTPQPRCAFFAARSASHLGQIERALAGFRAFIEAFPDDPQRAEAAFHAGELLSARGSWSEARKYLRQVPAELEVYPQSQRLLGQSWVAEGKLDRGLDVWQELVARHPERGEELSYLLGVTCFSAGRYEQAQTFWRQALERHPDAPQAAAAQFQIAQAALALQRFDEGRAELSRFLGAFPNDQRWVQAQGLLASSYVLEGRAAAADKREHDALAAWQKFIEAHPVHADVPNVLLESAAAWQRLEKLEKARATWRSLVAKYPRTTQGAEGQWQLALSFERQADLKQAVVELRRLREAFAGFAQAGWAQTRLSEMQQEELQLRTPRVFASDESLEVVITSRNIETLRFKLYRLDLAAYFEKKQTWQGVENLSIDIVEPAASWEEPTSAYEPYRRLEQTRRLAVAEPGAWLLQVEGGSFKARTLLIQSDLDMVVKVAAEQSLVFCLNRRTGELWPAAEVLQLVDGKLLESAQTGDDGVLLRALPKTSAAVLTLARSGKHLAFAGAGASSTRASSLAAKGYVFSERPVYRPGQTVQLKAFVRLERAGAYLNPEGQEVLLKVLDPRGVGLLAKSLVLDPFGAVDTELRLDAETTLGSYAVQVVLDKEVFLGSFEVEAYKKPEFLVNVAGTPTAVPGDSLRYTVEARYLFGGPVADAEVSWQVYSAPYTFDGSRYEDFNWFIRKQSGSAVRSNFVSAGSGRTDAQGRLQVELRSADSDGDLVYMLAAEVRDLDRRFARGSGRSLLTQQGWFAVLRADRKLVQAGDAIGVSLKTVDAAHLARSVEGSLQVVRLRPAGVEELLFEVPAASDAGGNARLQIKIPDPGDYLLRYQARDARGQLVRNQIEVSVAGAEDEHERARVLADKKVYREGEQARVLVQSPVTGSWGLLSFEAERVLDYTLVRLDAANQTIELPMRGRYAPNAVLKLAIPGRDRLYEAEDAIFVIQYLDVRVESDAASYAPGETAVFTLTARDVAGQPVEAQLAFALVDEAVYQIAPDALDDIRSFFNDSRRALGVGTAGFQSWNMAGVTRLLSADALFERKRDKLEELALLSREMDELEQLSEAVRDAVGAGGGAAGAYGRRLRGGIDGDAVPADGAFYADPAVPPPPPPPPPPAARPQAPGNEDARNGAEPLVRQRFADTAIWRASLTTDAAGQATLRVPLPHNLTTWRATVRGADRGNLFGQVLGALQTSQPVAARLGLPRFVVVGDQLRVAAIVHNQTGDALTADLTLSAEGLELAGGLRVSSKVDAHSRKRLEAEASAREAGLAILRAEVQSPAGADALELPLPILARGVPVRTGKTLFLGDRDSWASELPADALAGSGQIRVRTFPAQIDFLRAAALNLERFPYACVEQTVNRFLPSLALAQTLARLQIPDEEARQRLNALVEAGVARLLALQRSDGGFGWWREGGFDALMTAYAVLGLSAARDQGVYVDPAALYRAHKRAQSALGSRGPDVDALLLYAMGKVQTLDAGSIQKVYRQVSAMSGAGIALLTLAQLEADRPETIEGLIGMLVRQGRAEEGRLSWAAGGGFSAVEASGFALLALVRSEARLELCGQAARWLREQALDGTWQSTRDTSAAVQGLCAQLTQDQQEQQATAIQLLLRNEGRMLALREEGPAEQWGPKLSRRLAEELARTPLEAGELSVELIVEGGGAQSLAIELSYLLPPEKAEASTEALRIERRYQAYNASGGWEIIEARSRPEQPSLTQIQSGEKLWVQLSIDCQEDLRYVEISDAIPAGCEILREDASGNFQRMEARDQRAVFFASQLKAGKHQIRYLLRAITPGRFLALPSVLRPMYEPLLEARSAVTDFRVLAASEAPPPPAATPDASYAQLAEWVDDEAWAEVFAPSAELLALDLRTEPRLQLLSWRLQASLQVGTAGQIVEAYEALAALRPNDRWFDDLGLLHDLATAYVETGEHETALSFYRRLFEGYRTVDLELARVYSEISRENDAQRRWREVLFRYPNSGSTQASWFAWAQRFGDLPADEGSPAATMLPESLNALTEFIAMFPGSKRCADAQLLRSRALYRLDSKAEAADEAVKLARRYPESERLPVALQLATQAYFEADAFESSLEVGEQLLGNEQATSLAPSIWHIFAQIHHIRGQLDAAVAAYEKARNHSVDAADALAFLTEKRLRLPELITAPAGRDLGLELNWKNLSSVDWQIYRVDLPMLLTEELDLAQLDVDLTGIPAELDERRQLQPEGAYRWQRADVSLPIQEQGVYLIVAKTEAGDQSAVALLGDLQLEVQKTRGRTRVYVTSRATGRPVEGAYLRISNGSSIAARGTTDARGIFETTARCKAVVASKDGDFALWR